MSLHYSESYPSFSPPKFTSQSPSSLEFRDILIEEHHFHPCSSGDYNEGESTPDPPKSTPILRTRREKSTARGRVPPQKQKRGKKKATNPSEGNGLMRLQDMP